MGDSICDPEMVGLLVCPVTGAPLRPTADGLVSTDPASRRCYPVVQGVPVLLAAAATVLDEAAWRRALAGDGPPRGAGR